MGVYDQINRAAALRFPGVETRWCFTSGPIRRKLAALGLPAQDPVEALAAMQAEGFARVAVVPLHLSDGKEFRELADHVAAAAHRPGATLKVVLGQALLTSETGWRRTLEALLATLPAALGENDRVILAVHGSLDPEGSQTLQRAARLCRAVDPRLMLGMLLGKPDLDEVVRACISAGVKKVWLLPCMVVAGYSARDEIAGAGEASWASVLSRAGIETVPVIRGLGEVAGVVALWMEAVGRLLADLESAGESGCSCRKP
jgi:sirohydrochlorin cobaltochelatase